jgi:hypothetical protein
MKEVENNKEKDRRRGKEAAAAAGMREMRG